MHSQQPLLLEELWIQLGSCSASLPWRLIAVILGSLCLVFLAISGVLGVLFFQSNLQVANQTRTLRQQEEILKNWTQLHEALESCRGTSNDLQTQTSTLNAKNSSTVSDCWKNQERKFYLFMDKKKTQQACKNYCSSRSSRLLKTENDDELNFLKPLANFHWIGLTRNGTGTSWAWEDGTSYSPNLFFIHSMDTCFSDVRDPLPNFAGNFTSLGCSGR
ncbi:hypothetical protein Y1Q_0006549 [Alligator mississippiensis]|uniref:C-type lectin domain-containing protein n=1 Tax=Alligator mississippiensis TaxID=8496 RepID=A0A151MZL0_ALLMI|nr:hypothetical protein Y1Q_0006549 [Alligator mississippiensis]